MEGFRHIGDKETDEESDDLLPFLEEVQRAFLADDIDALTHHCRMPFVVYTLAGVGILHDAQEFVRVAQLYRAALSPLGIAESKCSIRHRSLITNGRMTATARWTDFDEHGAAVSRSLVRYFLVRTRDHRWQIEMLEYGEMAVSVEDAKSIIH